MSRTVKQVVTILLFLVFFTAGILFFIRNNQSITVDYILGSIEMPISFMLLITLFTGAVLGVLATVPSLLRLKYEKSRLERQVKVAEKEIDNLRTIPVKHP